MYSGVASGIFAIRNCEKTSSGDIGRLPVTIGQSAAVIKAGAQYNAASKQAKIALNTFDKMSKSDKVLHGFAKVANFAADNAKVVLNTFDEIAKTDKVFNGLTKVVNFAADNVNPLLVASSGLKVALADKEERKNTLITESGMLTGMFLGEGWMKKHLDGILAKTPVSKKWIPIVKGVTFVIGSITASTIGHKVGKKAAQYWDKPLVSKEKHSDSEETKIKPYESMNYKA